MTDTTPTAKSETVLYEVRNDIALLTLNRCLLYTSDAADE